jgi:hypothetical protein
MDKGFADTFGWLSFAVRGPAMLAAVDNADRSAAFMRNAPHRCCRTRGAGFCVKSLAPACRAFSSEVETGSREENA